jgi:hypothetical protein
MRVPVQTANTLKKNVHRTQIRNEKVCVNVEALLNGLRGDRDKASGLPARIRFCVQRLDLGV